MAILSLLKIVKTESRDFPGLSPYLGGVITILSALVSFLILMSQGDKLELWYIDSMKPIICRGFTRLSAPCTLIFDSQNGGRRWEHGGG